MSELSAQAAELRGLAGDGGMEWVTGPIRASVLREAADMLDEHAKLREQTELLVTLLRNDCDIEASWDGLRKFWYIGLTESGCLMRDRACKAEADNAKLRELVDELWALAYGYAPMESELDAARDMMRELGIEVG